MSGCSYETLSLCKHGVHMMIGCLSCKEYKELSDRIKKLEQECEKGISRLKTLELKMNAIVDMFGIGFKKEF
jgi:hypothetical protein